MSDSAELDAPSTVADAAGPTDASTVDTVEAVEAPPVVDPKAASQLASGLVSSLVPPLETIEKHMLEIRESQQSVIESLEAQSTALKDDPNFQEVLETMALLPFFHGKLLTVRKDMMSIAEKVRSCMQTVSVVEMTCVRVCA
eukprot:m.15662 g.15662  ORF g.15662 m.15662 type:complete len:142 (+) comp3300_c0_seq1:257-682(+)